MLWLEVGRFVCHNPSWPSDVARYILLYHNVFLSLIFSFTSCARNTTGITGPYLSRELRDHPSKCSPQKSSTLFQHVSAAAVVNIVTMLSRSIAFSFHLKRSVTSAEMAFAAEGSAQDPAGELKTLPRPRTRLGRGDTPAQSLPPTHSTSQYRRLISMNLL